jgi:glycosyltransferase involved in cell wall biosynthesis
MMRIGIDVTPLPPNPVGAGNYIIHLLQALASLESEHEFIVFAQHSGRELIDLPKKSNVKWVIVPDKSPLRRLVWEQIALPRLAQSAGVELLHSLHYTRPLILPCASAVTFHDMTFFLFPELHTWTKRVFFPMAMRISARQADALLSVSESTRRDAIRLLHVPEGKIFTTPLGVNEEFRIISDPVILETCRRRYNLPETFILYVGLLEPRKNLPLLLRAYAGLSNLANAPNLVIVGRPGWGYKEILKQIDVLNLKDKIYFTGYVPTQDLPVVYNLAQVFVYPSIYEGFGLPPMEAMACGIPVITTDVSAMRDHVGEAGILIPSQDEDALTQAMQKILNGPDLREQLSIKGSQQAANFTWKRTALETLKVYQFIASKRASMSPSVS